MGSTIRHYKNCNDILDVWLFKSNIDISQVKFQKEEVCNAMWANKEKIIQLYNEKRFEANAFFEELMGLTKNLLYKI